MTRSSTHEDDHWTDSSNDSEEITSVSSEDELGLCIRAVVRGERGANQTNTSEQKLSLCVKQDSESQTTITGQVCYQNCYTGKSVVHRLETFRVVRNNLPYGYTVRDAECQTQSTGLIRTKEEINKLHLLPISLPRPQGNVIANNFHSTGMCDRATLLLLITEAVPTLTTEMLNTISAIIFNMVESQTNWDVIEAEFGIGLNQVPVEQVAGTTLNEIDNSIKFSDVDCNTDADFCYQTFRPVFVNQGVQAVEIREVSVFQKYTQTKVKKANKSSLAKIDEERKLVVDACVQTDIPVTTANEETQTPSTYFQFLCSVFQVSPLGLFILVLSSVHVFEHLSEVVKSMIFG